MNDDRTDLEVFSNAATWFLVIGPRLRYSCHEGALAGIGFDRNCGENRGVRRALVCPCCHRPQRSRDHRFTAQDDVLANLSADLLKERLSLDRIGPEFDIP